MNRVLVATVDGVKARFFRLAPVDPASADGRVCLVEWRTEANLEHGLSGRELFSDTRSGGNRSTAGSAAGPSCKSMRQTSSGWRCSSADCPE